MMSLLLLVVVGVPVGIIGLSLWEIWRTNGGRLED